MEGYRNLLMKGRYPVVILFLDLPPEMVDVNVHPTKHEVRFREQSQVHDFIAAAIRSTLRTSDVAGVVPDLAIPPLSITSPSIEKQDDAITPHSSPAAVRETAPSYEPLIPPAVTQSAPGREGESPFSMPEVGHTDGPVGSMRIIGQFRDSYILCQDGDCLVLIDQHAAHERVSFERLREQFYGSGVVKQSLLFPVVIEFDFREAAQIAQRVERFSQLGFEFEAFGGNAFALKAIPQLLKDTEAELLVRDVASELSELGESARLEDAFDHLLATMACHSVVRANQKLGHDEMRSLLREIDTVDFNAHCPHGRPVMQRLTLAEIERMFKRA
jgi:DNA mismatch repair protein MutL